MVRMILTHLLGKTEEAFSSVIGWICGVVLMAADVFSGQGFLVMMIVCLTFIDAVWGIAVARKRKKFALSELIRQTAGKFAVYGCALFGFLAIDHYITLETGLEVGITSGLIGVVIAMAELWSCSANMLIIYPEFPILKLLQKRLTGEIAGKLGCDPKEVAKILKKPQPRNDKGQFTQRKKK